MSPSFCFICFILTSPKNLIFAQKYLRYIYAFPPPDDLQVVLIAAVAEAISEKDNDIEIIVCDRKLAQLALFELGVSSHFLNLCALSGYLKEIGALVNAVKMHGWEALCEVEAVSTLAATQIQDLHRGRRSGVLEELPYAGDV